MKSFIVATAFAALLSASAAFAETLKVGVTPGPHAQIFEKVKEVDSSGFRLGLPPLTPAIPAE